MRNLFRSFSLRVALCIALFPTLGLHAQDSAPIIPNREIGTIAEIFPIEFAPSPADLKVLSGKGRITKLSYTRDPGHVSVYVESDPEPDPSPASPEPQNYGAWKTVAGMYQGLTPVAIKVDSAGELVLGPDPGGAVQRCQACMVIGGLNGLTQTALNVGADGTVAVTGSVDAVGMTFGSTILTNSSSAPTSGQCLGNSSGTIVGLTCSGGTVGGSPTQVQYNSGGVAASAPGITTPDSGNSLVVKGPNPSVNLAAFTRSINVSGCSTTATINIGTPTTATLASGACFQNGDGITIYGAGPSVTLSAPSAPSVTPAAISSGGTALGGGSYSPISIIAGATGGTTYSYRVIARTKNGGYTPPSSSTTVTTGLSSLGFFTCSISSYSRSGNVMTINFSSTCEGAVVGGLMQLAGGGTGGNGFGGFYNIQTAPSGTQVTAYGPLNSTGFGYFTTDGASPNSGTGGTAYFLSSNHLTITAVSGAYAYYICSSPDNSTWTLAGTTLSSSTNHLDLQWDDYGATMMAHQAFPGNITSAACTGSGQSDPLTTTISSGGGTTTVTLANAATNGVTTATALFDNGPGLLAAANYAQNSTNAINGQLFIPVAPFTKGYVINSYTTLPANLSMFGAGVIRINGLGTIQLGSGTLWDGSGSIVGSEVQPYDTVGGEAIEVAGTTQGIYSPPGNAAVLLKNMTFLDDGGSENGEHFIVDDGDQIHMQQMVFNLGGGSGNDLIGVAVEYRGANGSNEALKTCDHCTFTGGTASAGSTWAPLIYFAPGQNGSGGIVNSSADFFLTNANFVNRGIIGAGSSTSNHYFFTNIIRQSGVMPLLWVLGNSTGTTVKYDGVTLDTDGTGILSSGNITGNPNQSLVFFTGTNLFDNGGPSFTGGGPTDYFLTGKNDLTSLPQASGVATTCQSTSGTSIGCNFDTQMNVGPNAYFFWPMSAPAAPTVTAVAGGTWGASNGAQFAIAAVGVDGNPTIISANSSTATTDSTCPSSGNCQFSISWTAVPGAASYNIYECGTLFNPFCPTVALVHTGVTTTSYTAANSGSNLGNPVAWTQTGLVELNANAAIAPVFEGAETTAPTGIANVDQIYPDSTAHAFKEIANNGSAYLLTQTIASGTIALGTSSINSGACATPVTATATGALQGDNLLVDDNASDLSGVAGYGVSTSGVLNIYKRITTNTVTFTVCNSTGGPITPGAVTLQWRVMR
jgi:hypothetical protein